MTDRALDALARRVMLDAARLEYGSLIDELPELDFSPAFEKKMRKLLRRASHPIRYRVIQTAACLLLAALLTGCSVLAFSPEAREAFAGWIRELRRNWSTYYYAGAVEYAPRNTVYCPTWLPEGYQEAKAPMTGTFVFALYENEDGSQLSFAYQVGLEGVMFHVERDNTEVRPATVSDTQADFYLNKAGDDNVLVWVDEAEGIVFWISAPLTEEELVRVAESVRESGPIGWIYRPTWFRGGGFGIEYCNEQDGEGDSLYWDFEGLPSEFFYSKSGTTPYADRTDGDRVAIGERTGMLYPLETGRALTWSDPDTGYALWLVSEIPVEDMVGFAEGVQIYMHNIDSVFEIDTIEEELLSAPLYGKVEKALTDEFIAQVKEYARRDAAMGVYMSSGYEQMKKAHRAEYISPDRDSAMAQVSNLLENNQSNGFNVLCLIEPFCFATIEKSEYGTHAHIFDKNGVMIAGYTSIDEYTTAGEYANIEEYIDANGYPGDDEYIIAGGLWSPVPTLEEMLYDYHVTQIYYAAYRETEADMNHE